jgi:hypothetical protein
MDRRLPFFLMLAALLVFLPEGVVGQEIPSWTDFEQHRQQINKTGMLVLGTWAVGNILTGAYGNFTTTGQARYFHQMNAMWNVVNLGIATFGYVNAVNADPFSMGLSQVVGEYTTLQNILLLNAGLDVAYMTAGFFLRERSKTASKAEMLKGYGNGLILQGAFLFAFDIALYFIHRNHATIKLYPIIDKLGEDFIGLGVGMQF